MLTCRDLFAFWMSDASGTFDLTAAERMVPGEMPVTTARNKSRFRQLAMKQSSAAGFVA